MMIFLMNFSFAHAEKGEKNKNKACVKSVCWNT